jgi:E3 ubiquitin-protein ligase BIG BROTHER-like protein
MNGNRQMEVHYMNTDFPYTTTESFMDFFEGLTHAPVNYAHNGPMHDQVLGNFYSVFVFEKKRKPMR